MVGVGWEGDILDDSAILDSAKSPGSAALQHFWHIHSNINFANSVQLFKLVLVRSGHRKDHGTQPQDMFQSVA